MNDRLQKFKQPSKNMWANNTEIRKFSVQNHRAIKNYEMQHSVPQALLNPPCHSINISEPLKGFKVCIFYFCREKSGDISQYDNSNPNSFQDFTLTLA